MVGSLSLNDFEGESEGDFSFSLLEYLVIESILYLRNIFLGLYRGENEQWQSL